MFVVQAIMFLALCNASDTSTIVIPLAEVWALGMPKTKDIHKLDTKKLKVPFGTLQTGPLDMLERLEKKRAEPGFVVNGLGQVALEEAHRKLPDGKKPETKFAGGSELSLVFFSHGLGRFCHIQEVKRTNGTIHVAYQLVPHGTENGSSHIALIPLGKLPVGEYQVKIHQIPLDKKSGIPPLVGIDTTLSICQPFSFSVLASGGKGDSP